MNSYKSPVGYQFPRGSSRIDELREYVRVLTLAVQKKRQRQAEQRQRAVEASGVTAKLNAAVPEAKPSDAFSPSEAGATPTPSEGSAAGDASGGTETTLSELSLYNASITDELSASFLAELNFGDVLSGSSSNAETHDLADTLDLSSLPSLSTESAELESLPSLALDTLFPRPTSVVAATLGPLSLQSVRMALRSYPIDLHAPVN